MSYKVLYHTFVSMPTGYQVATIFVILIFVCVLLVAEHVSCQIGSDWKRSSFGAVDFGDGFCREKTFDFYAMGKQICCAWYVGNLFLHQIYREVYHQP